MIVTETEYKNLCAQFQRVISNARVFSVAGEQPAMTGRAIERVNLMPVIALKKLTNSKHRPQA